MKRTRILYKMIERLARRFRFVFLSSFRPVTSAQLGSWRCTEPSEEGARCLGELREAAGVPNAGAPPAAVFKEMSSHFPSLHHFTARGSNLRHQHPRALLANAGWDPPRAAMFSNKPLTTAEALSFPSPYTFCKLEFTINKTPREKKNKNVLIETNRRQEADRQHPVMAVG